ncbi:hypothetical protein ABZ570_01115 [Micromonospora sp. NPDC007271]|uniref:hypothetical protein n=1 Tax=Micromonospora sp. NPDC007271 TaxID=3154587 RepID=UPI0033ECBD66
MDHWITEYRHDGRWMRIDSESLGGSLVAKPEDLAAGEFLTGGEAWSLPRSCSDARGSLLLQCRHGALISAVPDAVATQTAAR